MEPPSNQNFRGNTYSPLWTEEDKVHLTNLLCKNDDVDYKNDDVLIIISSISSMKIGTSVNVDVYISFSFVLRKR